MGPGDRYPAAGPGNAYCHSQEKGGESGIHVPDEVTEFIARQITSNIRELEGALIRVVAYCNLFNTALSTETAREVLKDMVQEVRARISLEAIQRRVAEYFELDVQELRGARRQRSIMHPRQIAMFLCRRLTEASLPEIGRAFGGRDHTTILHAVDKIEREITQDIHKKQVVEHLHELITASRQR